jgi:hypothetical protein
VSDYWPTDVEVYDSREYRQYLLIFDDDDEEHIAFHYAREELIAQRAVVAPPLPPPFNEAYRRYLASPEWRERADEAKRRFGGRCALCNASGPLEAHHRTYDRVFNEQPEDITALCANCHGGYHRWRRLPA